MQSSRGHLTFYNTRTVIAENSHDYASCDDTSIGSSRPSSPSSFSDEQSESNQQTNEEKSETDAHITVAKQQEMVGEKIDSEGGEAHALEEWERGPVPGLFWGRRQSPPREALGSESNSRIGDTALDDNAAPNYDLQADLPVSESQDLPLNLTNGRSSRNPSPVSVKDGLQDSEVQGISASPKIHPPSVQAPPDNAASFVDLTHVRPSLQMTAQEFSEAKMIILDLLGWGVPSEYLLRCGLAREAIYYAFTEMNLRLPSDFDADGIVPYDPPPHYMLPR